MNNKVEEIISKITAALGTDSDYMGGDMLTAFMIMAGMLAKAGIEAQGIELAKVMLPGAIQLFLDTAGASSEVSILDGNGVMQ